MAFHFSLAAVLKLRKSIEQQEYLNLEKIHQEIAHSHNEISNAELRQAELQHDRDIQLSGSMPSIHLQNIFEQIFALEQRKDALKVVLAELAVKKDQQLKIYNEARQKREVLESVRERQHTIYQREEGKRQQASMDDLFLARFKRK